MHIFSIKHSDKLTKTDNKLKAFFKSIKALLDQDQIA